MGIIASFSMAINNRFGALKAFAAVQSRKEIEKALNKARKEFGDAQAEYKTLTEQLAVLQGQVEDAQQRMAIARETIIDSGGHIQTMDGNGPKISLTIK